MVGFHGEGRYVFQDVVSLVDLYCPLCHYMIKTKLFFQKKIIIAKMISEPVCYSLTGMIFKINYLQELFLNFPDIHMLDNFMQVIFIIIMHHSFSVVTRKP